MKQYVTHGTGSAQTLSEVQNTNVIVYDTKADAEADLSNLSEGQIVATKDSGDELAQPVDTVALGNMHAVTSNAVANSNAMPVDQVALNNLHSVTSNAVANFAFDKSRIRTGICTGGSANNDDWVVTFDVPFQNNNYIVAVVPSSYSGAGYCPNGWYVIGKAPTGFSIYCNGYAPLKGFEYIAINYS